MSQDEIKARASERRSRVQHLRQEGKSQRVIASALGVSQKTVHQDQRLTFDTPVSNVSAPTIGDPSSREDAAPPSAPSVAEPVERIVGKDGIAGRP